MSIRMLAIELYRVMQEIEKLEKKLEDESPGAPRDEIEQQLKRLRAERDRFKAMLEGAKE